jgi:hypothetical protein
VVVTADDSSGRGSWNGKVGTLLSYTHGRTYPYEVAVPDDHPDPGIVHRVRLATPEELAVWRLGQAGGL